MPDTPVTPAPMFTREDVETVSWVFYNVPDIPPVWGARLLRLAERIGASLPQQGQTNA